MQLLDGILPGGTERTFRMHLHYLSCCTPLNAASTAQPLGSHHQPVGLDGRQMYCPAPVTSGRGRPCVMSLWSVGSVEHTVGWGTVRYGTDGAAPPAGQGLGSACQPGFSDFLLACNCRRAGRRLGWPGLSYCHHTTPHHTNAHCTVNSCAVCR